MSDPRERTLREAVSALESAGIPLDSPAAAIALEFLLRPDATRPSAPERAPGSSDTEPSPTTSDETPETPAQILADWARVDEDRIRDHFDLGADSVQILVSTRLLPASKSDRQRVLGLLRLAVDRVAYGQEETPAREVNAVCAEFSCLDQNLASHLTSHGLVTRRGRRGSHVYRLTQPGLQRAKELFQDIASGAERLVP